MDSEGHESDPEYNDYKFGSREYDLKRIGRITVAILGTVAISYLGAINQDHLVPLPGADKVAEILHDIKLS